MSIERYAPRDQDKAVFSFTTPEEGRKALKMAIHLAAGKCGEVIFLPIGDTNRDLLAVRGYVGFVLRGDKESLSALHKKAVRAALMDGLAVSDEELRDLVNDAVATCGTSREKQMDNWKHRSDNMKCKTCMWFVPKAATDRRDTEIGQQVSVPCASVVGRCRRHSPTISGFPVVFVDDWCGDHKLDENKA